MINHTVTGEFVISLEHIFEVFLCVFNKVRVLTINVNDRLYDRFCGGVFFNLRL